MRFDTIWADHCPMQTTSTARIFGCLDRPFATQVVWKPDGITMRRVTADPSGAFGCLCGHHGDDEKVNLSDAFQTSLRALFQDLRGAHAPTSRIAFIVFLNPRILSTLMRL
jgi:hypothetical protein